MRLSDEKRSLRLTAQAARAAAAQAADAKARAAATARLLSALEGARVVSGYLPIRDEIDPLPGLAALHAQGAAVCMPVVAGKDQPLTFRLWSPGCALVEGPFRVMIPAEDRPMVPEVLVTPMLAFDRAGFRLGYGGGFYDRTLAALRAAGPARAVGFAWAAQEVASVPRDRTDARLDLIVTEAEAIHPCG